MASPNPQSFSLKSFDRGEPSLLVKDGPGAGPASILLHALHVTFNFLWDD